MAGLSEKEINSTLAKIRKDYDEGAEKYGNRIYNLMAFNDRYREALKTRQDLSNFLLAEIRVLEDIKASLIERDLQKQKQKQADEEAKQNSFMNKVDDIIERFQSAIEKYPRKFLNEKSDDELMHLYGAFDELYNCFSVIRSFCCGKGGDYVVETAIKDYENRFQQFVIPIGEIRIPQIFADYVFGLKKGENTSRAEQFILKESGFFLHSLVEKLESIRTIALKVGVDSEIILPEYLHSESPRVYKFFTGKSREEIYDATIAYAKAMIVDFRLQSFKKDEK